MLEKLAWWILARQMRRYRKASRYHHAEHIEAAMATKIHKECALCCILENTDWLAWITRFDPSFNTEERYASVIENESRFGDVVRRVGLD
jgi:hypothetical protein